MKTLRRIILELPKHDRKMRGHHQRAWANGNCAFLQFLFDPTDPLGRFATRRERLVAARKVKRA